LSGVAVTAANGKTVMEVHHSLAPLGKVFAVAFAVGFDVLALSISVGVARLSRSASLRVGIAFAAAEIAMQLIGYELGATATHMLGEVADVISLALLFLIGCVMVAQSFEYLPDVHFEAAKGTGLFLASLSISLDSLGVGLALPALGIPLTPLLVTVSITTVSFTLTGLAFGAVLGERYERNAERTAGVMLILITGAMALGRLV
jgi:putative Mn2+ efflux pump MntP